MESQKGVVDATLTRSIAQLGEKLGINDPKMEEMMATKKTAEDVSMRSMQVAKDAGDYKSQAEAVGDQKSETREPGAAPTSGMSGSQVQSVNLANDQNYGLTAAKLVDTVHALITAGQVKTAQDPAAPEGAGGAPTPAGGPAAGGAPAAAPNLPAAGAPAAGAGEDPEGMDEAAPMAAPGAPISATDTVLQQKITEISEDIQSKQQVVKALEEVAQEANVPIAASRRKQAGLFDWLGSALMKTISFPGKVVMDVLQGAVRAGRQLTAQEWDQMKMSWKGLNPADFEKIKQAVAQNPQAMQELVNTLSQGGGAQAGGAQAGGPAAGAPAGAGAPPATASRQKQARGPFPYGVTPPGWVPSDLYEFWREAVERAVEEEGEDPADPAIYRKVTFIYKALVKKHGGEDVPVSLPGSDPRSRYHQQKTRKSRDLARQFKQSPGDTGAPTGFGGIEDEDEPTEASRRKPADSLRTRPFGGGEIDWDSVPASPPAKDRDFDSFFASMLKENPGIAHHDAVARTADRFLIGGRLANLIYSDYLDRYEASLGSEQEEASMATGSHRKHAGYSDLAVVKKGLSKFKFLHVFEEDEGRGHSVLQLLPGGKVIQMVWSEMLGSDLEVEKFSSIEDWASANLDHWWVEAAQSARGAASDDPAGPTGSGPITEQEMRAEAQEVLGDSEDEGGDEGEETTASHRKHAGDYKDLKSSDFRVGEGDDVAQLDRGSQEIDDPDRSLADEARKGSPSTPKAKQPQVFGDNADKDYAHLKSAYLKTLAQKAKQLKQAGKPAKVASKIIEESQINSAWKQLTASYNRWRKLQASAMDEVAQLMKAGSSYAEAMRQVRSKLRTKAGMQMDAYKSRRAVFGQLLQAATDDPDKMDPPAGDASEYAAPEVGDRKDDEVSEGTDTTLVSPETSAVERQADGYLNNRHSTDIAGSSVTGAFASDEHKKLISVLRDLDSCHDGLKAIQSSTQKNSALGSTPKALNSILGKRIEGMKQVGDAMVRLLKLSSDKKANKKAIRDKMSEAVVLVKRLISDGGDAVKLAQTLMSEIQYRNAQLNRVGPALKLSLHMAETGHIEPVQIPEKMASFIQMNGSEFEKVASVVNDLKPVNTKGSSKTASRLPLVRGGDNLDDSLSGIFNDDEF